MKRRTLAPQQHNHLPEVGWHHDGIPHRVRLAPSGPRFVSTDLVVFERMEVEGVWERFEPDPMNETFASAALTLTDEEWFALVGQLPPSFQDFLRLFRFERLEALAVVTQAPALLSQLDATPGLTLFVASHVELRGTDAPRWNEITAVFEREGIFGVLQWLGLPACPQTLAILAEMGDPEFPRADLPNLRTGLWEAAGMHPLAA